MAITGAYVVVDGIKTYYETNNGPHNPNGTIIAMHTAGRESRQYELVQSLREANMTPPVLMITAKDGFDDMRQGFLAGADDYMVKPVNVNEILLRVQALLRRARVANERRLYLGGTTLDCDSLTVSTESGNCILPQKEFMLLFKMASFPGRIFTRQQLMDDIWGYKSDSDMHTVDVHISRLRERFRDNPDFHIRTIRGLGYKIERPVTPL